MELNPNIILNQNPVNFGQRFQEGRRAKIEEDEYARNVMRQQQQDARLGRQDARLQREDDDEEALKGIFRGSLEQGADGSTKLNETKLLQGLYQRSPEMAMKLQQQFQERDINAGKLKNESIKSELSLKTDKAKYWRDAIVNTTPEGYGAMLQQAQQDGMGFANGAPAQYDPNWIRQQAMTADKFLESQKIKAPTTRTVRIGNDTVTQEFDESTGAYKEIGRGSAFAPKEPTLPSGYEANPAGGLQPIKGGPQDPNVKTNKAAKVTEGERKAATLLKRLEFSENQLTNVTNENIAATKPGLIQSGLRSVGADAAANYLTSGDRQKVEAAQLDILDAALTLGTGAAYTREQLEGYRKSYFPQIGDEEGTIADKADRLKNVIDAAKIAAGNAAPSVEANPNSAILPKDAKMPTNGYNGKTPPKDFPRARKAPDGNWYIKNANGTHSMVTQ